MKKDEKKKKFKLFDLNRDGKGVEKPEDRTPNLKFFFKLCKRKFSQILRLNLMMLLIVIPLLVVFFVVDIYGAKTATVTDVLYAPLYGISQSVSATSATPLLDLVGVQMESTLYYTPVMLIVMAVMFLFLAITFGWQNVGAAYVLRGLVRGDPVFVFSDYFYAIRRNLKQAFFLGLVDFICVVVLVVDYLSLAQQVGSNFGVNVMYFMVIALILLYIVMRFYIYQLLVTFDLTNLKILKNALIFTVLGIKRNALAFFGILLLIILHVVVIFFSMAYGLSVFLILPFLYLLGYFAFIGAYAAYPVIDRYMIAPYAKETALADTAEDLASEEADAPAEE